MCILPDPGTPCTAPGPQCMILTMRWSYHPPLMKLSTTLHTNLEDSSSIFGSFEAMTVTGFSFRARSKNLPG